MNKPLASALACAICALAMGVQAAPQNILITNESGQPVGNAAVSVVVRGTRTTATTATAEMAQRNKAFAPNLVVIQTGTSMTFPNFDTVRHHVYSFSKPKTFEIKLYAGTPSVPVLFDKAGTAVLGCNIHDRMVGYIHIVDTPYFAVSDASGRVTLDLPPGEHTVKVWTPLMGEGALDIEQSFKTGASVTVRVKG
jgi:plastocyanin